jgi:FHS family L-fucose permease-like MFS transporter
MAMTPTTASTTSASNPAQTYRGPFAIMTVLFFMWGFMTVFNDILIPRFKVAFTVDYYHAMFVQLAFFGAYFIGSLIYFLISAGTGNPIAKIRYKNGVIGAENWLKSKTDPLKINSFRQINFIFNYET